MEWYWIVLTLFGVMLVIILCQWHFLVRYKKRHRSNTERLNLLEEERQRKEASKDEAQTDDQVEDLLRHRAQLIARLLVAEISGDSGQNESVMDELGSIVTEREEFIRQNRLLYERWQPNVISHLRACGLTDDEVGLCCLYALGLNGKAIQQYTRDGRHYQKVGAIRKKLGLGEHDRNIDGYIKSLMK